MFGMHMGHSERGPKQNNEKVHSHLIQIQDLEWRRYRLEEHFLLGGSGDGIAWREIRIQKTTHYQETAASWGLNKRLNDLVATATRVACPTFRSKVTLMSLEETDKQRLKRFRDNANI